MNSHELANQLNLRLMALAQDRSENNDGDMYENGQNFGNNQNDYEMQDIGENLNNNHLHILTNEDDEEEQKGDIV